MSQQLDALHRSLIEGYSSLAEDQQNEIMQALQVLADDQKYNRKAHFFPDTGVFRRELYPKHLSFFEAGAKYTERGFIAANQVGKSEAGAFETTCHATGKYPDWWKGKRFHKPTLIWVGGDTSTTSAPTRFNPLSPHIVQIVKISFMRSSHKRRDSTITQDEPIIAAQFFL